MIPGNYVELMEEDFDEDVRPQASLVDIDLGQGQAPPSVSSNFVSIVTVW